MSKKLYELMELINAQDLKAFEVLTSKKKASVIIQDFEKYHKFQSKINSKNTEEENDRYYFETDRYFVKANKEIKMLDENELLEYINAVNKKVKSAFERHVENSYISNSLLFRTMLNQMPNNLKPEALDAVSELKLSIDDYESLMSM